MWRQVMCKQLGMSVSEVENADWTKDLCLKGWVLCHHLHIGGKRLQIIMGWLLLPYCNTFGTLKQS